MTSFKRVQGDINDSLIVTLSGVQDLTTVSAVEAHVWTTTQPAVTLAAAVADSTARTIKVQLGGSSGWLSTAVPANYLIEYQVTFGDGSVLTWPAAVVDQITVRAQGA